MSTSRIQKIDWSKLIERADPENHGCELSWNHDYVAEYQFDDPTLRQRVGKLISQARRNIPFVFQPELLAALSVVAILMAGALMKTLTKVSYAWWGIALISVLCILGIVFEQRVSTQWIGRVFGKLRHRHTLTATKNRTLDRTNLG